MKFELPRLIITDQSGSIGIGPSARLARRRSVSFLEVVQSDHQEARDEGSRLVAPLVAAPPYASQVYREIEAASKAAAKPSRAIQKIKSRTARALESKALRIDKKKNSTWKRCKVCKVWVSLDIGPQKWLWNDLLHIRPVLLKPTQQIRQHNFLKWPAVLYKTYFRLYRRLRCMCTHTLNALEVFMNYSEELLERSSRQSERLPEQVF
eukprot:IDg23414t1